MEIALPDSFQASLLSCAIPLLALLLPAALSFALVSQEEPRPAGIRTLREDGFFGYSRVGATPGRSRRPALVAVCGRMVYKRNDLFRPPTKAPRKSLRSCPQGGPPHRAPGAARRRGPNGAGVRKV